MNFESTISLSTKIGNVSLALSGRNLLSLSICNKKNKKLDSKEAYSKDNMPQESVLLQLNKYFSSVMPFHDIPLAPSGTEFQKTVWNELIKIPLGETRTYGQIAIILNSSARAVGNACRRNPIQIIIPCHRVVSAKGLGGYAGKTEGEQLAIKRWLLKHEGCDIE